MPECAKAHLQQSKISKIFQGDPGTPAFWGGERGAEVTGGNGRKGAGEEREGWGREALPKTKICHHTTDHYRALIRSDTLRVDWHYWCAALVAGSVGNCLVPIDDGVWVTLL